VLVPTMSPDEIVAGYRRYAAECIEIAQRLEPEGKLALLHIAQAWLNLADQIAKNYETTLVYESPEPRRPVVQQQQQPQPQTDNLDKKK
jgi:hypothetical protein